MTEIISDDADGTRPTATKQKLRQEFPQLDWSFRHRHGLLLVLVSPILANVIGSAFNIVYNQVQVQPLLSDNQMNRFFDVVWWFNVVVYPIAIACFVIPIWNLRPIHAALINGKPIDTARLTEARRKVIHLPWWFLVVAAIGWLGCVPTFPLALAALDEPLGPPVVFHLITSFVIASLIAITHSFFAVELTIQQTLFPVFFQGSSPATVPGAVPLGIGGRGILWTFSTVLSPIVSLLLILLVPDASADAPLFAVFVGLVAVLFGFATTAMLSRLVLTPIRKLKNAALQIAAGDLDTLIDVQRADELGLLIDSFHKMVDGLKERERIQETFGRHVGRQAAREILSEGDAGEGRLQTVSVLFLDVRNFTQHSSEHPPESVIAALNVLFAAAVERTETNGGMVNKFLGDGLMALFGVGRNHDGHADEAIVTALELLNFVEASRNEFAAHQWPDFEIGIGINTGPAIIGSIGSSRRREYTAMGSAVNIAARVESLTKSLSHSLVVTESTRSSATQSFRFAELPRQKVKGRDEMLKVYGVQHDSRS